MYSYIIGNVSEINSNNIVLECNKIGYMIYVPNPFSYKVGEEYKVYTYNNQYLQQVLLRVLLML